MTDKDREFMDSLADETIRIMKSHIDPIRVRVAALEQQHGPTDVRVAALERQVDGLTKDLVAARERLAANEVRASLPGVPGPAGRDGADGVGFDDVIAEHDGE